LTLLLVRSTILQRRRCRRVGKGALATCPPWIADRASKGWAPCALPTLRAGPCSLHVIASAAKQSIFPCTRGDSGLLRCARNDDVEAMLATNRHDGQITSDFQKSCQAQESKIFRFRSHANQSHNSARLTADEGRWPSSRTRGEMRWTRELRLTCVAQAYGEVVWFGRRGAGAKLAVAHRSFGSSAVSR
jgi:hypothetical protein